MLFVTQWADQSVLFFGFKYFSHEIKHKGPTILLVCAADDFSKNEFFFLKKCVV